MDDAKVNDDLTYQIIGCAMKVHSYLGNGFQEVIYQRALAIKFKKASISFVREFEMIICYHKEGIGTGRVDFLVDNTVSVELKAVTALDKINLAQGRNYLEAYNPEKGLLINSGSNSLEIKRLLNRKFRAENRTK